MATMVGLEEFDQFLFEYVQHFREQLVTSEVSPVFIFMASDSMKLLCRNSVDFHPIKKTVGSKFCSSTSV